MVFQVDDCLLFLSYPCRCHHSFSFLHCILSHPGCHCPQHPHNCLLLLCHPLCHQRPHCLHHCLLLIHLHCNCTVCNILIFCLLLLSHSGPHRLHHCHLRRHRPQQPHYCLLLPNPDPEVPVPVGGPSLVAPAALASGPRSAAREDNLLPAV